jgi:hypothetical protein
MACKNCGHPANRHDYNPDWKIRETCHGISIKVDSKHGITQTCKIACKRFVS